MKINIGIEDIDRREIAGHLEHLLADSYALYLKTHYFHWNVSGPLFNTLHLMFEGQYVELATAVDDIAERIRALGEHAPGSFSAFQKLSRIEDSVDVPSAEDMIRELVLGHEVVIRTAREAFDVPARVLDEPTCDLLTQRMQVHEKAAWMLRSMLDDSRHASEPAEGDVEVS